MTQHQLLELNPEAQEIVRTLFNILHPVIETHNFPKTCGFCNRVYQNEYDYVHRTKRVGNPIRETRSKQIKNQMLKTFIDSLAFQRNCVCHGTLQVLVEKDHFPKEKTDEESEVRNEFLKQLEALGKQLKEGFYSYLRKNPDEDLVKSPYWKYINSLSNTHGREQLSPDHLIINSEEWPTVAMTVFRDHYNSLLRELKRKNHPSERWVIFDSGMQMPEELFVAGTSIVRKASLEETVEAFKENPEHTSALVIPAQYTAETDELIKWIRKHNGLQFSYDNIPSHLLKSFGRPIKGYITGNKIATIGYSSDKNSRILESLDYHLIIPTTDIPETIQKVIAQKKLTSSSH